MISIFSVHDYVHELTELTLAPDNGEGQAAAMNFGGNKNRWWENISMTLLTNQN